MNLFSGCNIVHVDNIKEILQAKLIYCVMPSARLEGAVHDLRLFRSPGPALVIIQ